ncbi:621_t:CDS:1 [Cetraspora pellucida]|uniref:620_t:CDS:1 n=2 Tax=Cetraspora pellucida TaxID=1433469 RepID=A0ACA9JY05_9GLOM|nr:620_t:CDS:1 [Cetraspora pellucida]CAG8441520.1 621_t:CDS:1 [Cetraspora pellucida]
MASKIILGNISELVENILNNLNNEIYSLYSCSLVNRLWCKASIPMLWQDPFSLVKNPNFISSYFSSFDEDGRFILKNYGIIVDIPNTSFHYASFLKVFNCFLLDSKVEQWIKFKFFYQRKNIIEIKNHLVNLLFKTFIESGATLSRLDLFIPEYFVKIKSETFDSLSQNRLFLSQLNDLYVDIVPEPYMENFIATFLRIIYQNSRKINNLKIGYNKQLSTEYLHIIRSQAELKSFSLLGNDRCSRKLCGVISALENQKKTLKEIVLDHCVYNSEFKVLMKCENLEIIRISYCDEKLFELLNISLCRISTLEISSYSVNASDIIQILETSGSLLQRLKLNSADLKINSQSLLLKTLMAFCPNIIYLYISSVRLSTQFVEFISSSRKLQFLTLCWINEGSVRRMRTRVMQFAKVLPPTLQYLDLSNFIFDPHITSLLINCNAPLKKLLFHINYDRKYEKRIKALLEFCTRKRTLNSVNVNKYKFITGVSDDSWNKIKRDIEGYTKLVSYECIVVAC